jgi:hypothetical protein
LALGAKGGSSERSSGRSSGRSSKLRGWIKSYGLTIGLGESHPFTSYDFGTVLGFWPTS